MTFLRGKVAIVTGAAVGLGNAFARALAGQGADVVVCDIRPEISELTAELEAGGTRALALEADVARPADVRRVVDAALSAFGGIDVLVNNAGTWAASLADDPLDKSLEDYERLVGTNLKGEFLFGRAVMPHLIERGGGDIVNISTDHVHTCGTPYLLEHENTPDCPYTGKPPRPTGGGLEMDLYDASKWGLSGLTLAWSQALAPHGIRVNALCMGATDSYMLRSFHNFDPDPKEVASWMKAEDVARLLVDLLREGPGGRTGENIGIAVGHPIVLPERRPSLYVMEAS